ncbi:hypothetical protein GN156_12005 [bacterium LRH843]|nr:hypothetical protein [bacterium LRH843]
MGICTICNGMNKVEATCSHCQVVLIDFGRIMDYEDKYHAYEEIDLLKQNNGITNDLQENLCPHYVTCPACSEYSIYLVQEQ